jgi:hypothetical protein
MNSRFGPSAFLIVIIIFFALPRSSSSLRRRAHHLLRAVGIIIFFAPSQSSYLHCAATLIIFIFAPSYPTSASPCHRKSSLRHCDHHILCAIMIILSS